MPLAVETDQLGFQFSKEEMIIRAVDLKVPQGIAYGILGPNGAGKSTLMRLLLGLLRPRSGSVRIYGKNPTASLGVFRRIGAMIEDPRLYPHLSGRDNLRVFATYRNIPFARIGEVLAVVRMEYAADRLVRHYSTGMRQRLGIALALLPDPDLLLLDEPTNGLDPQGIAEMRRLIQRLHREAGKTVLVSSHILSEVEQMCTHVGILHQGQLRFQGTMEALRKEGGSRRLVLLETGDGAAARQLLTAASYEVVEGDGNQLRVRIDDRTTIPALIDLIRNNNIALYQVRPEEDRLEDFFLRITENREPKTEI